MIRAKNRSQTTHSYSNRRDVCLVGLATAARGRARPKGRHYRSRPLGQEDETSQMSCCFAPDLSAGVCVKRYGPRLPIKHDYFDKVLSRKGAAPATGRDTLIKLQGRVARKLDTQDSENRPAGLPT